VTNQEAVNRFFVLPIFVLFGLALPWGEWLELGWAGLILVGAVLLLRRLPAVVALNPLLVRSRGVGDALFLGWFGPIGWRSSSTLASRCARWERRRSGLSLV